MALATPRYLVSHAAVRWPAVPPGSSCRSSKTRFFVSRFSQVGGDHFRGPSRWHDRARLPPAARSAASISAELPAREAAVTIHTGPYDSLGEAHAALEQFLDAHGLTPAGPSARPASPSPVKHPTGTSGRRSSPGRSHERGQRRASRCLQSAAAGQDRLSLHGTHSLVSAARRRPRWSRSPRHRARVRLRGIPGRSDRPNRTA